MPAVEWMIKIPAVERESLFEFRKAGNVLFADDDAWWWLRGNANSTEAWEGILEIARRIPGAAGFTLENSSLIPVGCQLPIMNYPELAWAELSQCLQLESPKTRWVATPTDRAAIRFERTATHWANCERETTLLLCQFSDWFDWVVRTSEIRLSPLSYAVDETGETLVRGTPIPPLSGLGFVEYDNVALPVGFSWKPAVSVNILNQIMKGSPRESTVVLPDESIRRVQNTEFVQATRSAIRETASQLEALQ